MTTREAVVEFWTLAGEPSDFDPWVANPINYDENTELDPASAGVKHYLKQLSFAQQTLANWRTSRGRPIRFDKFFTRKNVKVGFTTQDYPATVIDKYTLRLTTPAAWLDADLLEGSKIIFTYTPAGGTETSEEIEATIAEWNATNIDLGFRDELDADIAQVGTTSIHFNQFLIRTSDTRAVEGETLVLPTNFRNIVKLLGTADSGEIYLAESKEALDDFAQTLGLPSKYYTKGEWIYLDAYIDEPFWLTVEYQRTPNDVTDLDDVIDIPKHWHSVLPLLVELNTSRIMHENQKTQLLTSAINREIGSLRTDAEERWERTNTSGFYIRKEART